MGWSALKNGQLLAAAATQFEVFLTVDSNLRYQQHLPTLPIAVLVMVAVSNRLSDLIPLAPRVEIVLQQLVPRTVVEVSLTSS